jgi:hypothetical protein
MPRRLLPVLALVGVVLSLPITASAQKHSASGGAVIVRPVQVNEVRVHQPAPRLVDQRPSFGVPRPVDPAFISRPHQRPQIVVSSPRPLVRHHRRHRVDFKPRFKVGSGIVVGYPVLYPYAYPYDPFSPSYPVTPPSPNTYSNAPSPNTYSNVDSLPNSGNVSAVSRLPAAITCEAAAPCGGISFDISPASAQVYVDGVFAGIVEDFDASSEPLVLAPGNHYVEIRRPGYRTVSFDVTIAPGEITPYQGTLERLRLGTP